MPDSSKNNSNWILVQPGLFKYPLTEGEKPALFSSRCTRCGKTFFPKRPLCPYCFLQGKMEDITPDSRGRIYTSTVVHVPSLVGIKSPYAYGYVDIPANKIRILALFTGGDPYSFKPGEEVELVLEPIHVNSQGQEVIGYKFKPVS